MRNPFVPDGTLVPLLGCLAVAGGLSAQDAVRGWGTVRYDTAAYELPATDVAAAGDVSAVLRADGRIFVHGATQLTDGALAPAGTSYVQIAIGEQNGFGLLSTGAIATWGTNGTGLPAPGLPPNTTYVQVAAGTSHVLALRSDGVAVAWGANGVGQATVPVLPAGVTVRRVRAAGYWSLLLLSNGTLAAFGSNNYGQTNVPALPAGVAYTEVWTGPYHAIASRSDGAFVAWGSNASGQGNVPALPAGVTYTTMGVGGAYTVALRTDGVVLAWGDNSYGQTEVPAMPPGTVAQIVAGSFHTLVRFVNGAVVGWGRGHFALPLAVPLPGERWIAVASGFPSLGLTSSGQVAQFGNANPMPFLPPGLFYTDVVAAGGHSVALRSDGRAVAWGDNSHGQIAIPPLPPGMSYTAADAAFGRTVLLRSDGMAVECGAYGATTVPVPPPGTRYEQVSCHSHGTILRRSDGAVVVIGGQSSSQTTVPALPAGLRYVSVAMTRTFSAALRSDGEVVVWGSALNQPLPALPSGVVYVEIDGGDDQLAARSSDGRIAGAALIWYDSFPNVPVPAVGESFVEVSAYNGLGVVRVGPTSTYVSFAPGCAGSRPASRLVPADTPRLGRVLEVTVFDLPQDAAVMVFGWSRTAPIPLAVLGLPGCSQHVTVDAAVLLSGQDAQAQYRIGIPNAIGLVGLGFRNQAIVLDPAANAAGAVVSDAAEGIVGHW